MVVQINGGDEFIICLPNLCFYDAKIIGERLREKIENSPYEIDDLSIQLTVSVGIKIISYTMIETMDINQFISDVDYLMYQAKEYRNSVSVSE